MSAPASAKQNPVVTARPPARPSLSVVPPSIVPTPATLVPLSAVPLPAWEALAARAVEANACYRPDWALAVARHARGRGNALALAAFDSALPGRLTGLMPVRWARHALSLPLPLLVSWNAYAPFSAPLLDRDCANAAAEALIEGAQVAGARALLLQTVPTGGPAYEAMSAALSARGLIPQVMRSYRRAGLDARPPADDVIGAALSAKKLKELRRQRNRLQDEGTVVFETVSSPDRISEALDAFLALEAAGWKGARGTALAQHDGDAAFIREAAGALAASGHFEIVRLMRGSDTLAAGLILRDGGRAWFFKIAMDERHSRNSPGVQLTLDLTRHLCADPDIAFADSSADGEHPMIDHIWRERIEIADMFVPLSPRDPVTTAIGAIVAARYRAIDFVRTLRRIRETST